MSACLCTACSSEAKQTVNEATARAAAETMRATLKADNLKNGETVQNVSILQAAADKIPGSPQVSGIQDANNDRKDDDGKVTITVGNESACLTAHTNGDIDVTDNAC